jgi:hypothetical protein
MTILDRIVAYVKEHAEGVDDDELAWALELKRRQRVDSRCSWRQREGGSHPMSKFVIPKRVYLFEHRDNLRLYSLIYICNHPISLPTGTVELRPRGSGRAVPLR